MPFFRDVFGIRDAESDSSFGHMLAFAQDVSAKNPDALNDVMRLFLRPLQTELLVSSAFSAMHSALDAVRPVGFFTPDDPQSLGSYAACPRLPPSNFQVVLSRDPVLACPWRRNRYSNAVADIGSGKSLGSWKSDSNHQVIVLLPWGIAFVAGGNHSIAAGILSAEGSVEPAEVWDLSSWLTSFNTDGRFYFNKATGEPICIVTDPVRAAIFEVGRLMLAHDVVPMLTKNS